MYVFLLLSRACNDHLAYELALLCTFFFYFRVLVMITSHAFMFYVARMALPEYYFKAPTLR